MFRFRNRLLSLLPVVTLEVLDPHVVQVSLRERLDDAAHEGFVYFLEDGVASVIADVDAQMAVEMGLIGREGVTGLHIIYDDPLSVFRTVVQVDGNAAAVDASRWHALIKSDETVRTIALKFARAFSIQVASTALANGRAKLDERLARWLLMVADRAGPTFPITHEFISFMLGVRRSGVTLAVQALESSGAIHATRGSVTILDRPALTRAANGSYGFPEAHYERLLGAI